MERLDSNDVRLQIKEYLENKHGFKYHRYERTHGLPTAISDLTYSIECQCDYITLTLNNMTWDELTMKLCIKEGTASVNKRSKTSEHKHYIDCYFMSDLFYIIDECVIQLVEDMKLERVKRMNALRSDFRDKYESKYKISFDELIMRRPTNINEHQYSLREFKQNNQYYFIDDDDIKHVFQTQLFNGNYIIEEIEPHDVTPFGALYVPEFNVEYEDSADECDDSSDCEHL